MRNQPNRTRRKILVTAFVFLVLVGIPSVLIYRERRQARLNHELIQAIKGDHEEHALELLRDGAEGTANENDVKPRSVMQLATYLVHRILHPNAAPTRERNSKNGALAIYYNSLPKRDAIDGPIHNVTSERLPLALLNAGAPADEVDSDGVSAVYYAARLRHHSVLRRLVEAGVNINSTPDIDFNAALLPADAGDSIYLLNHGAQLDRTSGNGESALFHADAAKAKVLLGRGIRMDIADFDGKTALMNACYYGRDDAVRILLKHSARVDVRDKDGFTALLYAAGNCRLETVKALLDAGSEISFSTQYDATALLESLDNTDDRVFEWILAHTRRESKWDQWESGTLAAEGKLQKSVRAGRHSQRYARAVALLRRKGATLSWEEQR